MADVFISYKKERRAHAERLAIILEAHGFEVWWDHDLLPAAQFDTQIESELDGAAAAVVLWCSGAIQSKFVKSECRRADRSNKLVQTHLEDVSAPIGLDQDQSLSLIGWTGAPEAPAVRRLIVTVSRLTGRSARSPSSLLGALEAFLPPLPRVEPIIKVDPVEREATTRTPSASFRSAQDIETAFFKTCSMADDFEAYLIRYPEGHFAKQARSQMDELDAEWIRNLGLTAEDWSTLTPGPLLTALGTKASRAELERRARRGSPEATTLFALKLYAAGDHDEAVALLRKAAGSDFVPAQARLGYILSFARNSPEDKEEGTRWTKLAAAKGNATAQNNYGALLSDLAGASPRKRASYLKWYEKSANQGYALAQLNLGREFFRSGTTPEDWKQSVDWLNKAAAQGEAEATQLLGRAYLEGRGTEVNPQLAAQYFKRAADSGDSASQLELAKLLLEGNGITKNEKRAVTMITRAAEGGELAAFMLMGELYETGRGVEKDLDEALGWYDALGKWPEAQARVKRLKAAMRKK
ncbi:MAG: toll/interleukin-1 receptor domain-containing protein [Phycisphaerales bacterium]|nr:toll/interleukin-1 receptor domain-containing protein [Hyphomonadaceae bacterium]